jgi:hypothetical protein
MHDCGCTSEMQFWSHGSSGNGMSITGDGEFDVDSFDIPGVQIFGGGPVPGESGYQDWYRNLSEQQRRLVVLRRTICDPDSEVYYRSCLAFQGKSGQDFAEKSATFWRSEVVGHTKLIGLSQPGQKTLKPGEKAYWPETEGLEEEGKKGKTGDFMHIKPR